MIFYKLQGVIWVCFKIIAMLVEEERCKIGLHPMVQGAGFIALSKRRDVNSRSPT